MLKDILYSIVASPSPFCYLPHNLSCKSAWRIAGVRSPPLRPSFGSVAEEVAGGGRWGDVMAVGRVSQTSRGRASWSSLSAAASAPLAPLRGGCSRAGAKVYVGVPVIRTAGAEGWRSFHSKIEEADASGGGCD